MSRDDALFEEPEENDLEDENRGGEEEIASAVERRVRIGTSGKVVLKGSKLSLKGIKSFRSRLLLGNEWLQCHLDGVKL